MLWGWRMLCVFVCGHTRSLIKGGNLLPDKSRDWEAPPALLFSTLMKFDIHGMSLSLSLSIRHTSQGEGGTSSAGALDEQVSHTCSHSHSLFFSSVPSPDFFPPLHSQSLRDSSKTQRNANLQLRRCCDWSRLENGVVLEGSP